MNMEDVIARSSSDAEAGPVQACREGVLGFTSWVGIEIDI
jgi:hypothetical protein